MSDTYCPRTNEPKDAVAVLFCALTIATMSFLATMAVYGIYSFIKKPI
jgi:hypothetical protein